MKQTKDPERDEFYGIASDCAFDYWKLNDLKRDRDNAQEKLNDLHKSLVVKYGIKGEGYFENVLTAIKAKIANTFIGEGK